MNLSPSDIGYNKKYPDTYSNFLVLGDRKKLLKKSKFIIKLDLPTDMFLKQLLLKLRNHQ